MARDTVHAVATEGGLIAGLVGDDQNLGSLLIVDGQEDQVTPTSWHLATWVDRSDLLSEVKASRQQRSLCPSAASAWNLSWITAAVSVGRIIDDADLGTQLVCLR